MVDAANLFDTDYIQRRVGEITVSVMDSTAEVKHEDNRKVGPTINSLEDAEKLIKSCKLASNDPKPINGWSLQKYNDNIVLWKSEDTPDPVEVSVEKHDTEYITNLPRIPRTQYEQESDTQILAEYSAYEFLISHQPAKTAYRVERFKQLVKSFSHLPDVNETNAKLLAGKFDSYEQLREYADETSKEKLKQNLDKLIRDGAHPLTEDDEFSEKYAARLAAEGI